VSQARRAPLDGLRAVAVLGVVTYHLGGGGASVLPGGFLGVDLFFVLSGYLITGLLVDEHRRTGAIRLGAFWARRARRLLPAALLVLLAVSAATWWSARPETWPARREDVFWAAAYLANWHFVAVGEDYFAGYAGASPLRHTWSLSIEEQFYALWPLVVLAALSLGQSRGWWQGRRALATVAAMLVGASALAMAWDYQSATTSRAYYGTDGRVQQLLVGALLALALRRTALRWTAPRQTALRRAGARSLRWLGTAGALTLGAALVLLTDDSPIYYRGGALGVALAGAAIIAAVELAPASALARGLSWRPAVALGRVSYGVYLWHWPVLVYLPLPAGAGGLFAQFGPVGWWATQALRIAATLGLATASYLLVERPILAGRVRWLRSGARTAIGAVAAVALVAATSVACTRLPGSLQRQLADRADRPCPGEAATLLLACVQRTGPADQGSPDRPVTLLLGDSTARALEPGLADQIGARGGTLVQAAWQRCSATGLLVVPNGQDQPDAPALACTAQAGNRIRQALARYRPARVLVSEFWAHHQGLLVGGRLLRPGTPEHATALRTAYLRLVDEAGAVGAEVVLVETPPPGSSLGPVVAAGRPAGAATTAFDGRYVTGFNELLREVAARRPARVVTVSLTDLLCPQGPCGPVRGGRVIRTDGVHVTAAESRALAPTLLARADAALAAMASARAGDVRAATAPRSSSSAPRRSRPRRTA
jgi:peptidoglycan/LPS O-acetylase OafA/YrhL